jgi:hypothetical protein
MHAFTGTLVCVKGDEQVQLRVAFPVRSSEIGCRIQGMQGGRWQSVVAGRHPPLDLGIDPIQREGQRFRNAARRQTAQESGAEQEGCSDGKG